MSMHREEGPPPIDAKWRMPLRLAVIGLAYVAYVILSDIQTAGAVFVGLGAVLIGLGLVDRWTVWRRDRSGLMQVGMTVLGIGLLVLGASMIAGADRSL